jgi:hypothetical protein
LGLADEADVIAELVGVGAGGVVGACGGAVVGEVFFDDAGAGGDRKCAGEGVGRMI